MPGHGKAINEIGETLNEVYFPKEYAEEIQGCAVAMGVPVGWASLFNIGYEVSDAWFSFFLFFKIYLFFIF